MCQTPIVIVNRSRRFTDVVSPRYFRVVADCSAVPECHQGCLDVVGVPVQKEFGRLTAI